MKTITVSIDESVYVAAQRVAIARDMSISQLVAEYLQSLCHENTSHAERARRLDDLFRMADARSQPGLVGTFQRDEIYHSKS